MTNKTITRKPIQAGDYGKPAPKQTPEEKTVAVQTTATTAQTLTDGRKTLALWSH